MAPQVPEDIPSIFPFNCRQGILIFYDIMRNWSDDQRIPDFFTLCHTIVMWSASICPKTSFHQENILELYLWLIKQMNHYHLILINITTFHKSHRRLHRNVQDKIKVVPIPSYVLVRTTQSKGVNERGPKIPKHSKFNQFLPSLCTCFKSTGRQRKDLITHANRGQIESTSEVALNRPKGNIINLSGWSRHTGQSQSSSI